MKRIIQMSLMLCVCFLHLNAQTASEDMPEPKKNSIYIEGGGNGLGMDSIEAILPVEIFFSYGTKSCLELGLGYTFVFEENNREDEITFRSSYKYRGPEGFIFGVGVLARMDSHGIFFPVPHLSIGFSF